MHQTTFFDAEPIAVDHAKKLRPAPAQRHSPTSVAAAEQIEPAAGSLRADLLAYLRKMPNGATDEEMQDALGMNPSTQRPRRIELVKAKLVVYSGRAAKTKSGREAAVWVAVGGVL